jgi:DNA gyrase inhibitor GyrI
MGHSTPTAANTECACSFATATRPMHWAWRWGTLPGGRYARVRLIGEPPDVYRLIGPTFERLAERADRDRDRPGIEFYRSGDVIDLLLPVL